jgi:glutamyl-tRNA synthetase
MPRTRLAPSPTGALHLGNARTFLINWALARQQGWEIVLRIEDLDGPRVKRDAVLGVVDTLRWLGLDWDQGPVVQSQDPLPYQAALDQLARQGDIDPGTCTRSQIAAGSLSAPHGHQHELRYSGRCRPPQRTPLDSCTISGKTAWRLRVPPGPLDFCDTLHGAQSIDVDQSVGDFLVCTKGGTPSYQLAVVVDDARQGIDQVVRGDDLLSSTPRQELLYERLAVGPPPAWTHVPIVKGPDGRRLAKRHGDTRIDSYREAGVSADRLVGLIGSWSGLGEWRPLTPHAFANEFALEQLPTESVTFTAADEAWLRAVP